MSDERGRERVMHGGWASSAGSEEPVAPEPVDPPLSDLGPVHADTVHPEAVDPPSSDLGPVHVDTVDQEPVDQDTVDSEPVDPDDELFVLGERCAQAYMKADALAYEAMVLLAEFDRRRGWEETGFSSTAEWLAWRGPADQVAGGSSGALTRSSMSTP